MPNPSPRTGMEPKDLAADPALAASPSSPAVSTKGFDPGRGDFVAIVIMLAIYVGTWVAIGALP